MRILISTSSLICKHNKVNVNDDVNDDVNNYINNQLYINKSNIQGVGVFTSNDIKSGSHIYNVIDNNRNINFIGSKVNHSYNPNSILKKNDDDSFSIFATKFINKNNEIVADYTNTPDFIKKPDPSWI